MLRYALLCYKIKDFISKNIFLNKSFVFYFIVYIFAA